MKYNVLVSGLAYVTQWVTVEAEDEVQAEELVINKEMYLEDCWECNDPFPSDIQVMETFVED